MSSVARSFGFNASAVAFGGLIKPRAEKKTVPIKAKKQPPNVALSPAGGRVESALGRYNNDGIKFQNARTIVDGTVESDTLFTTYTTTAISELECLDVFGIVTADRITSMIRSQRNVSKDAPKDEDSIFTIEATFHNLKIVGAKVNPPLDLKLFRQVPTYQQFISFFSEQENMENFAPKFGWQMRGESAAQLMAAATALASAEPIRCSLVTSRVDEGASFTQDGYSLILPDSLGTVHLAEVLVKPGLRRVNMLRFELQKPRRGRPAPGRRSLLADRSSPDDTYNATICSGEGNGSLSIPP